MSPYRDRYSDPHRWPPPGSSDTWLLIEAILTIMTALLTIVVVILRHPFTAVSILIVVGMVGAVAGWW